VRFEQKLNQFVALWLYYTRQTLSILPQKIKPNQDKPNNKVEKNCQINWVEEFGLILSTLLHSSYNAEQTRDPKFFQTVTQTTDHTYFIAIKLVYLMYNQ